MPGPMEFVHQSYVMGPDRFVHIVDEHLTDGVLKRFRLVPNGGVRIAPDMNNLIESAFSDFLRRKTTPFTGNHRRPWFYA